MIWSLNLRLLLTDIPSMTRFIPSRTIQQHGVKNLIHTFDRPFFKLNNQNNNNNKNQQQNQQQHQKNMK